MSFPEDEIRMAIEQAMQSPLVAMEALPGGCIAEVYRADLQDGRSVVAKIAEKGGLSTEAYMLGYLREQSRLPVPGIILGGDRILIMDHIANDGRAGATGEEDAAECLADLHAITAEAFGHDQDTLIGPLRQPNPWTRSWVAFFRDQRLSYMADVAHARGGLDAEGRRLIERLTRKLGDLLEEPAAPSLLHGDCWGGNILYDRGRVAAFVDPAIYHGHAEIELAFGTLFGTFGERFFARYREARPLSPGFFEARRDIYNLYPLLVHAALFGGHYGAQAAKTARRFV